MSNPQKTGHGRLSGERSSEHPDIKRIHGVFAAADLFPMEIPRVFLEYRVKNGSVVGKVQGIPNVFICILWSRGNFHGDSWLCV